MCIAVPGEIMAVFNTQAKVKIMGVETTVNVQLIENPKAGEYVLIHAGCAIERVNQAYYDDLYGVFEEMMKDGSAHG